MYNSNIIYDNLAENQFIHVCHIADKIILFYFFPVLSNRDINLLMLYYFIHLSYYLYFKIFFNILLHFVRQNVLFTYSL